MEPLYSLSLLFLLLNSPLLLFRRLKRHCKVGKGQTISNKELRSLCQQDLEVTFSSVHFGRALRATFPDAKNRNCTKNTANTQFVYGIVWACSQAHPKASADSKDDAEHRYLHMMLQSNALQQMTTRTSTKSLRPRHDILSHYRRP